MTDSAYPPPPPPNIPPPTFGATPPVYIPPPPANLPAGYQLPPGYQGPVAPDYAQPYQGYSQPYGQYPQPVNPGAVVFGSASAIGYQFGGYAAYSIVVGVLGVGLPLFAGYYFRVLPIFGVIAGVRAIMRGRVLGGAIGIGVNALAGIFSLLAAGIIG